MSIKQIKHLLVSMLAVFLFSVPVGATNWPANGDSFAKLLVAAQKKQWSKAREWAQQISLPVASTMIEWLQLRDGTENFQDYVDFLKRNSDWPGLKILRKSGEATLMSDISPRLVIEFFEPQPPQTGNGAIRLAEALHRVGRHDEASQSIVDSWKSLPFTEEEHEEALQLFPVVLEPFHTVRINNLIWKKRHDEAKLLLQLVNIGQKNLAKARIALQNRSNGIDSRIRAIPASLQQDHGLTFDRVVWRLKNDLGDSALSLFIATSLAEKQIINAENWAQRRLSLAHWLMREGRHQEAYTVASNHHLIKNGSLPPLTSISLAHRERAERKQRREYADLEWISGYLQLRFLNNPNRAIQHFEAFRRVVDTPISVGRAGYWLGLANESSGQLDPAKEAFKIAAREQTTFYGQLAAEKINTKLDKRLVHPPAAPAENKSKLLNIPVVQAGLLYFYAGHDPHAAWFLTHVAESLSAKENQTLAAIAFEQGANFATVKIAKENVKQGYSDIVHLFPLIGISKYKLPIPAEIALAVARQETEFRDTAVSSKKATGLMQIKPSTGQELADSIGLQGSISSLLRNRKINVLLGSTYLSDRLEEFDGSYILAFAAYNAGPRRVQEWLPAIGDPRTKATDPIDWIEHIPYGETRNYVMRVMEALTVYRIRTHGKTQPIRLFNDLHRGAQN